MALVEAMSRVRHHVYRKTEFDLETLPRQMGLPACLRANPGEVPPCQTTNWPQ